MTKQITLTDEMVERIGRLMSSQTAHFSATLREKRDAGLPTTRAEARLKIMEADRDEFLLAADGVKGGSKMAAIRSGRKAARKVLDDFASDELKENLLRLREASKEERAAHRMMRQRDDAHAALIEAQDLRKRALKSWRQAECVLRSLRETATAKVVNIASVRKAA